MQNIGEEIVGVYLKEIRKCDFIQYNLHHPDIQGEIDIIGLDMENKIIYICEVVTHLITGLQYTKNNRPDNVNKITKKFINDINYGQKYFKDFEQIYMLWSPIVKNSSKNAKYNQMNDIKEIKNNIKDNKRVELRVIINEDYLNCLNEIRDFASNETKELKSPVLRLMQIEEKLIKHLKTLNK